MDYGPVEGPTPIHHTIPALIRLRRLLITEKKGINLHGGRVGGTWGEWEGSNVVGYDQNTLYKCMSFQKYIKILVFKSLPSFIFQGMEEHVIVQSSLASNYVPPPSASQC